MLTAWDSLGVPLQNPKSNHQRERPTMPAVSKKQQRFMGMCLSDPSKARGKCPSKKVAREFAHKPPKGYKRGHPLHPA